MFVFLLSSIAFAQAETSFINVKSSQWNVVFRLSLTDTRIERMAARCGGGWVNACSAKNSPAVRQRAIQAGVTTTTKLSGTYTSCRDVHLPRLTGAQLQRQTLQMDARAFCEVLAPGSAVGGGFAEPGLRGSPSSTTGPARLGPRPTGAAPAPRPSSTVRLGGAPSAVARRQPSRPPPPPAPTRYETPTLTTAASLDEFELLELDEFNEERSPDPGDGNEKKKKKKKKPEEEPTLRDRSLPK